MIDAAVILLVAYGRLPWVGARRDHRARPLLLVGWRVLAPRGDRARRQRRSARRATWLLYAAIGFRIVTHDHTSWPLWLFWSASRCAVVAALFYVRDAWKELER